MSKKSNDSIEEFFKKGVRKSDITFRESDWQKMERMLDERAMVGSASPSRSLKRILGVVVIVALLSSIYFLIPDGDDKINSNTENQSAVAKSKDEKVELPSENQNVRPANEENQRDGQTETASANQSASEITDSNKEKSSLTSKSTAAIEPSRSAISKSDGVTRTERSSGRTSRGQSSSVLSSGSSASTSKRRATSIGSDSPAVTDRSPLDANKSSSNSLALDSEVNNDKEDASRPVATSSQPARRTDDLAVIDSQRSQATTQEEQVSSTISDQNSKQTSRPIGNASEMSASDSQASDNLIAKADSADAAKEDETIEEPGATKEAAEEDKKNKSVTDSRWSVAFVVAPEFSSTSFDKQTVPGSAYGFTIGYRIIDRLSISTGVIKTYKKYVGYGEDYQPPAGYWQFRTNGIVPDEVSGQCSVIEVPLMLQYDIMQREKSRFFASAGASSYRMLNEKYDYTFNEPNDGAADGWSTDTPSSYYFSVGHVSLGYDHRLYRGLYLGVEPYLKIPFGGIGWSNVNLLTMGAYVNVRYRFSKRN
jgi:hypothetical protein